MDAKKILVAISMATLVALTMAGCSPQSGESNKFGSLSVEFRHAIMTDATYAHIKCDGLATVVDPDDLSVIIDDQPDRVRPRCDVENGTATLRLYKHDLARVSVVVTDWSVNPPQTLASASGEKALEYIRQGTWPTAVEQIPETTVNTGAAPASDGAK